jgi:hypothetical protein
MRMAFLPVFWIYRHEHCGPLYDQLDTLGYRKVDIMTLAFNRQTE